MQSANIWLFLEEWERWRVLDSVRRPFYRMDYRPFVQRHRELCRHYSPFRCADGWTPRFDFGLMKLTTLVGWKLKQNLKGDALLRCRSILHSRVDTRTGKAKFLYCIDGYLCLKEKSWIVFERILEWQILKDYSRLQQTIVTSLLYLMITGQTLETIDYEAII